MRKKKSFFHRTDLGNAEMFASLYRNSLRYNHSRKVWLRWNSHWWTEDKEGQVFLLAKSVPRNRATLASSLGDEKRKEEQSWAFKSESAYRIKSIEQLARSEKPLADSGEGWDGDPCLLGVSNGVVDLRTGELRAGQPEDHITLHTPYPFNPTAQCPRWIQFIGEIFGGDEEMVRYIQRALGYSISGQSREQVFFLAYGDGENGKGTMFETVRHVIGPYAHAASFTTFTRKNGGIPEDRAAMKGKRFITASEPNEGTHLDEALIKVLTGEDRQRARYLYENSFEFDLCGKIWLAANHLPVVKDNTHAMWRRIHLIEFSQKFDEGRGDKELRGKLQKEAEGILAWFIRGCLDWQKEGLRKPKKVEDATQDYRRKSDDLGRFLEDCCIQDPEQWVAISALRQIYESWCEDTSLDPMDKATFNNLMLKREYKQGTKGPENKRVRAWVGLLLRGSKCTGIKKAQP